METPLARMARSTACVAIVVSTAFVLTIVAVSYRPPDLQLEPPKVTAARMFGAVRNATFDGDGDESVLVTGEDLVAGEAAAPAMALVAAEGNSSVASGKCDPGSGVIDCSDPGVLAAIEMANRIKFPDMGTVKYGVPVRGSSASKCEVEWRFNNRKDKSRRMYRDFREYTLLVNSSCDYVVERMGRWHSGMRASSSGDDPAAKHHPDIKSSSRFWSSSYLYYSRGGDYCKGLNQYMWSLLCALGEAKYLNRTLVLDTDVCLASEEQEERQQARDFRLYFDLEHLQEGASVVEQQQFLKRWSNWNKKHPRQQMDLRIVEGFKVPPMQLLEESSSIVWRKFERDQYWYRVCEGEAEKVIQRPWDLLWKSKQLMNIVNSICGKLEWDFDAVHIVRGRKAQDKAGWPNLDTDTRPEALLEKLDKLIPEGRKVYVASNEQLEGYFDKLRTKYRLHLLQDFKSLWAPGSQWYNETKQLLSNKAVDLLELDAHMQAEIDSEVVFRAKRRIETFGQLTNDCKYGINSC